MATWDEWAGFERPGTRGAQEDYLRRLRAYEDFLNSGQGYLYDQPPQPPAPTEKEGFLFGQFAKALGYTPQQAEDLYYRYINEAGGIANPGLRVKIPVDFLIRDHPALQQNPAVMDYWYGSGRGRELAEQSAQAWQDANRGGGFLRKILPALSVMLPFVVPNLATAMGLIPEPAAGGTGLVAKPGIPAALGDLSLGAGLNLGGQGLTAGSGFATIPGMGAQGLVAGPGTMFAGAPLGTGLGMGGASQAASWLDTLFAPQYAPADLSLTQGLSFGGEGLRLDPAARPQLPAFEAPQYQPQFPEKSLLDRGRDWAQEQLSPENVTRRTVSEIAKRATDSFLEPKDFMELQRTQQDRGDPYGLGGGMTRSEYIDWLREQERVRAARPKVENLPQYREEAERQLGFSVARGGIQQSSAEQEARQKIEGISKEFEERVPEIQARVDAEIARLEGDLSRQKAMGAPAHSIEQALSQLPGMALENVQAMGDSIIPDYSQVDLVRLAEEVAAGKQRKRPRPWLGPAFTPGAEGIATGFEGEVVR